jgi:hypothetical protein
MERKLIPELQAHLEALSRRLGDLQVPLHAYIAGGFAANYHTGVRLSGDVDIKWSHRVAIPPDMEIFTVADPEVPGEAIAVTMDAGFSDTLGLYPPDWEEAAPAIARVGDIVIHMIAPLDLAVSKLARLAGRDRDDIRALAEQGLIGGDGLVARAEEALGLYVGDTGFIQGNLRDAVEMVRAIEAEDEPGHRK